MSGFVAAAQAGISAIPVDTATKKPLVRWKEYQSEIAELLTLQGWERAGRDIAVVCGEVSGRLVCIDIEGSFVDGFGLPELRNRLIGDSYAVFWSWMQGYSESTPSGGIHVLVRLEGDGPVDGNTKLAVDTDGKVLIETRGEGGYVIVAPSSNGGRGWELMSGGFETICYATRDEWAGVEAVLRTFDTHNAGPPAPTVADRSTPAFSGILAPGGGWIEAVKSSMPSMAVVLDGHGWEPAGTSDTYGEHWVRPGKDRREGHSASLSTAGRLWVHSSNAGLPVGVSLDVVDVLWCYEHGSDRQPTLEERTGWLGARRPSAEAGVGAAEVTDPVAPINLPPEFWTTRGYLAHVHEAALSQRLSPDAVWAGIKCFYAATIPWNHRLPGDGTVDYVAIVVGSSGAGKSQAKHAAWRLLESCWAIDGVHFPVPVGSGEGMTEIYLDRTNDERRYKARGVGFYADEGKFLLDIGGRAGATTIQAIKQMWSGELTGSVAATAERHRWLNPRDVRATLLISTTPDVAAQFLRQDLTDEGLPQRISWSWAHYDHPDDAPDWPGPLDVAVWDHNRADGGPYEIELDTELATLVDARRLAAAKGQVDGLHEGHATYAMLKSAAIHAHLDGRMAVNPQDWALAESEWEITRMVRRNVLATASDTTSDRNHAAGRARAQQKLAEDDVYLQRAVEALKRKLTSAKEPLTMRQIKDHLRYVKQRHGIDHREVIERFAISRGWAAVAPDGGLRRAGGSSRNAPPLEGGAQGGGAGEHAPPPV